MTKARRGVKRSATKIITAYSAGLAGQADQGADVAAGDTGKPVDLQSLDYRDLQALAKAAGMRSVGVSRVDLISGLQGNEQ